MPRELQSTASPVPKEERTHEFLQKFYDEVVIASTRRGYVHDNVAIFEIVPQRADVTYRNCTHVTYNNMSTCRDTHSTCKSSMDTYNVCIATYTT